MGVTFFFNPLRLSLTLMYTPVNETFICNLALKKWKTFSELLRRRSITSFKPFLGIHRVFPLKTTCPKYFMQ